MILGVLRALGILIAAALVLPAAANASTKVTWPELRTYAPGEKLTVKVVSTKPIRAVLVRRNASGKATRVIARRVLRKGTFSAAAPTAGRYALKIGTRSRTLTVVAPPSAPRPGMPATAAPGKDDPCWRANGDRAELHQLATAVRRGDTLPFELVNTGAGCLFTGAGYSFQRQASDGTWLDYPTGQFFIGAAFVLRAGQSFAKSAQIPADAEPGHYRLLDSVSSAAGWIPLSAEFDVLP